MGDKEIITWFNRTAAFSGYICVKFTPELCKCVECCVWVCTLRLRFSEHSACIQLTVISNLLNLICWHYFTHESHTVWWVTRRTHLLITGTKYITNKQGIISVCEGSEKGQKWKYVSGRGREEKRNSRWVREGVTITRGGVYEKKDRKKDSKRRKELKHLVRVVQSGTHFWFQTASRPAKFLKQTQAVDVRASQT